MFDQKRMTQQPVVLAQAVYDPNTNTLQMAFNPNVVEDPAMAAADVIKACANVVLAGKVEEKRKPQILVPRMVGF